MNALAIGERVILRSFNGTAIPPQDCKPGENYWLLIGSAGKIVSHRSDGQRMVVEFETSVHSFGLHCHNEIANSLIIKTSDLKPSP